jgi:hypothetical protein
MKAETIEKKKEREASVSLHGCNKFGVTEKECNALRRDYE